jgi:uncharacterized Zn finger protein (UPF0148 family)
VSELEVLTCTQCGAAIPFGDAAASTCPFCGTANEVPAAYREMRGSKQLDAASRAEAERLLKTIDRPPWLATKVLARMFDFNFLAFLMVYGIPLTLWIVVGGMRFSSWIAPRMGYRTGDDVPLWITVTFMFTVVFVVTFLPRMLGIYANRRVTARMKLLAALAARPAKTAGGPALCRQCGAPLFVEAGNLLAVCDYCGTQNAVQLRTSLVAAAGKASRSLAASVKDAAATDRRERRSTQVRLLRDLAWHGGWVAFFALAFALIDRPFWGKLMPVLAGLALIALPIISMSRAKGRFDDTKERRGGNDVPGWVAMVGPLLVWFVFIYGPRGCL